MSYRITGLSPEPFRHLFGLPDAELQTYGVKRYVVNESPGFPDRITMSDVEVGETVLLLNYEHQPAATPYRASHAIFVHEHADKAYDTINEIPDVLSRRILSLRAFSAEGMMVTADVTDGKQVEPVIERMLSDSSVAYIHIHNAKQGCYAGRVDRV